MRKRIQKKRHLGKFREYGIELELNLAEGSDVDKAFDDFIDYVESQGWATGGGGNMQWMSQFITYNEWAGVRKTAYKNLTQEDAGRLREWLEQQPWCAEIAKLEIRDAWYGWHWTEREPDKSKINRAILFAKANEPQATHLASLLDGKVAD